MSVGLYWKIVGKLIIEFEIKINIGLRIHQEY
jgi:hypothetical protein